jgi:hypothetical protein
MEIDGIPLHFLVNDAAVALVPLSVLAAFVFALLPSWRWLSRWAALLTTVGGLVALALTLWSGRDLYDSISANLPQDQPIYELLQTHQDRARMLLVIYVVFAVVVALAFFLLPARSHLDTGRLGRTGSNARWVSAAVPAALVVVGLAALVAVALTGHAGAQAAFG